MAEWNFIKYDGDFKPQWDRFVTASRNGTFLFMRDYMDYHAYRFDDFSIIALKDGNPAAMLPANITPDGVLHSHQGLTYGGWILPPAHLDCVSMMEMWQPWLDFCRKQGLRSIDYKPLPYIYACRPSQEDLYLLFRSDASLESCLISSTVELAENPGFNTLQRRHLRKGMATGAMVMETDDVESFMAMTRECLADRHDSAPVHSTSEISMLREHFPKNIRIFCAFVDDVMHAGVMIYDTGIVAHCQYISTTPLGRELNLLSIVFHHLIGETFSSRRYFDFGTSNEQAGHFLNEGLYRQKASLGGSGVAYTRYSIPL